MHHIIARKVATNSMSYPSENLWKPLTQILYNGYFGSEYPAIKYVRSGYNTHTPLSNSKAHVVLLGKGNNCLWRQGRLKLCHCLCLARLFGKKKIQSLFCLKILDTICWGRNAWQSSKTVCSEGKDQKDVFNAKLYISNRRSSVNSFSYMNDLFQKS